MKITERKPLRQRGRSDEKRKATKDAIREVYANGPTKAVQIIPATKDLMPEAKKKKLRVCAYCRVSTDEETQASSYELQVQNYTKLHISTKNHTSPTLLTSLPYYDKIEVRLERLGAPLVHSDQWRSFYYAQQAFSGVMI